MKQNSIRKRAVIGVITATVCMAANAQRIDFNCSGRNPAEGTAPGYEPWTFGRVAGADAEFYTPKGDTLFLNISVVSGLSNGCNALRTSYWKQGVINETFDGHKLICDMAEAVVVDEQNNYTVPALGVSAIRLTVQGLPAGPHTLLAYHNITDNVSGTKAPLCVEVNGHRLAEGIEPSCRAVNMLDCAYSYVHFTCGEGDTVEVVYRSEPTNGESYAYTSVPINAMVFDEPNPVNMASSPNPLHLEYHVAADSGSYTLTWHAATSAVRHHVMLGTQPDELAQVAVTGDTSYVLSNLDCRPFYYWRIDEEDKNGQIYTGDVWCFRVRHLSFSDAEGYGRFAAGGRGGDVYHVTSLADDDTPGTFRYGVTHNNGPRTIVFDVSGIITLRSRLRFNDFITVAGQTAPGKGICFRSSPMGLGNDNIVRFIRVRLGYGNTADGLGMGGVDAGIIDHCSISWAIDEQFSSRNARNITLQRTLISEALSVADHKNYGPGADHGFAGSVSGDIGSLHHNLLAHNSGRNWSLAGGLDNAGFLQGRLDIFNMVVYNWRRHACYNGAHEVNFVNNYYKRGPATEANNSTRIMLEADPPSSKVSTQRYYFKGNVMPGVFDENNQEVGRTPNGSDEAYYNTEFYKQWVDAPFFPSYAHIESAREAYKNVLSDVGCILPVFDDHDRRVVDETLKGTYHYTGSVGGQYGFKQLGIIDRESDCGGYETYPEEQRPSGFDTDYDGVPDWFEEIVGSDLDTPDHNEDPDGDGFTRLDDYLEFMAHPHYTLAPNESIDMDVADWFKGYEKSPVYTAIGGTKLLDIVLESSTLRVSSTGTSGLTRLKVTVKDAEGASYTRAINVAVTPSTDAVSECFDERRIDIARKEYFSLDGRKVNRLHSFEPYILRITDTQGKVYSVKILAE